MKKTFRAAVATVFFVLIFILVYVFHINVLRVDVVFYAALSDALVSAVFAGIGLFAVSYFSSFGPFEKQLLVIIWLLIGYSLAISVPTVIDRSLSFYILEKLQQRGGGILQNSFQDIFVKEYVNEHRLVDVRLTEQLASGTIIIVDGCVRLTSKGNLIATFSRFFRKNLLPKKRLLMGKYTDDLTDPFRSSDANVNYECSAGNGDE
jgi:hypothetical protein